MTNVNAGSIKFVPFLISKGVILKKQKCTCPEVLFLGLKICQGPCLAIIYKNNSLNRSGNIDTNRPFMMGKALMRLVLPHQFTESYVYGSYVFFFLFISWFPFLNMKFVARVLLRNRDVLLHLLIFYSV